MNIKNIFTKLFKINTDKTNFLEDKYPSSLDNIDMSSIKEVTVENNLNLEELILKIKKYKMNTIKIIPKKVDSINIYDNKIGGTPYWPKDMTYPKNSKDENLYLLAQLNLNKTPSLDGYPKNGILQFFILDDDTYGCNFTSPEEYPSFVYDNYKIVYHPNIINDSEKLLEEFPTTKKYLPIEGEYKIEYNLVEEYPPPTDYLFEEYIGDVLDYSDEDSDYIYDSFISDGCKIGGYSYFTQEDPRYNASNEWILLLQVDSSYDDNIKIMWGDGGVANFFIEKEKLMELDFSNVWYNWDCS